MLKRVSLNLFENLDQKLRGVNILNIAEVRNATSFNDAESQISTVGIMPTSIATVSE